MQNWRVTRKPHWACYKSKKIKITAMTKSVSHSSVRGVAFRKGVLQPPNWEAKGTVPLQGSFPRQLLPVAYGQFCLSRDSRDTERSEGRKERSEGRKLEGARLGEG